MNKISDCIAPSFYKVHDSIKKNEYVHYFLKGGRGSTKSSFVSVEIILGIMTDAGNGIYSNAICFRKYATDIKDSVYAQINWAIDILGVGSKWTSTISPLRFTYKPTGQTIYFRGCDDPTKIKSIKPIKGFFKYIWYEEAVQFDGMEEIRNINQSLLRGGYKQSVFYSYNPPQSVQNWINYETTLTNEDRLVHHSTFLSVPKEWLGRQFIAEAKFLKENNETLFNHEYLGEVTGTGGEVFHNVKAVEFTKDDIDSMEYIRRGLDFGYSQDPTSYICCNLHNGVLKIYHEFYSVGASFKNIYDAIKKENRHNEYVTADCAEPRSISELNMMGLKVVGCTKTRGMIEYGIMFLQGLREIQIDPKRCPNTYREFTQYETEKDKNGNFKSGFPDKNNHSIDAVRYALQQYIKTPKIIEKEKNAFERDFGDINKNNNKTKFVGIKPTVLLRRVK